ncbi:hypothetical protein GTP58_03625 [Duganella sp. CY15W]|uniref:hypothetical protein n=1 Tax=Duganella sp. CY15W TaxID=2692172 RepID=UPI001367EE31|nr:hypothetical protein [Duganella sp. CY15W]MYM27411.1 hypothetical protein [Duganella sp. CY15W]
MRVRLNNGYDAEIIADGGRLDLFLPDGHYVFTAKSPEFSTFFAFADYATKGVCPLISFAPEHKQNGWMDWFCEINVRSQSITLLNPWR